MQAPKPLDDDSDDMELDFGGTDQNKENKPSLFDHINKKRSLQQFKETHKKLELVSEKVEVPKQQEKEEPSTAVQEKKEEETEVQKEEEQPEASEKQDEQDYDSDVMVAELAN